ncbi:hypothetical protein AVEN_244967-1 [Araneus ventricosus]|uniref:Uncharacterized protein n=1 Tax=Araneus ventricosus TaxID=182803 RepID=A0A4Y2WWN9_ARAVE|nr:hypothetical protein AVEN_244967-1 [Araneus ventricosus]
MEGINTWPKAGSKSTSFEGQGQLQSEKKSLRGGDDSLVFPFLGITMAKLPQFTNPETADIPTSLRDFTPLQMSGKCWVFPKGFANPYTAAVKRSKL